VDVDYTIVICGIDTRLKFKVQGLGFRVTG